MRELDLKTGSAPRKQPENLAEFSELSYDEKVHEIRRLEDEIERRFNFRGVRYTAWIYHLLRKSLGLDGKRGEAYFPNPKQLERWVKEDKTKVLGVPFRIKLPGLSGA